MAKLYFYYGAMGSSKTANALMADYNYRERGQKTILAKTNIDTRDGKNIIWSRIGLERECILLSDICAMDEEELRTYDAIIVDEIQFAKREQINFLAHIVDDLKVPVLEGSERLLAIADELHEVKTVCWCGKKATCNARYNEHGIVRVGTQVLLGANDDYIALCRKHFLEGKLHGEEPVGLK